MINITKVLDIGNDTIEIHGFDDSNPSQELIAFGALSATQNAIITPAVPAVTGEMTSQQKQNYYSSKLQDQLNEMQKQQSQPVVLYENTNAEAQLTSSTQSSSSISSK